MSFTIKVQSDALSDLETAVEELGGAVTGNDVMMIMGRAAQQVIKDHFEKLAGDAVHHKTAESLGAERTGLYEEAARGTEAPQLESGGVSVSVHQVAIAQRLFGGTVEPVNAKFLTIPARSESYGKRAGEFDNLVPILFPSGAGALVQREATVLRGGRSRGEKRVAGIGEHRKGEEMGGLIYFWLVKQVTQSPDPSVLPGDEEILDPVMAAAAAFIDSVVTRLD